jgi:hypothetical protein
MSEELAAVKTLKSLDYTYHGGELWKPPIGKPPRFLAEQAAPGQEMTPEMMREAQLHSELGAYAAANLSGAYDLFQEFWRVALSAAPSPPAPAQQEPASQPADLSDAVYTVLGGFTLPSEARKILETAFYRPSSFTTPDWSSFRRTAEDHPKRNTKSEQSTSAWKQEEGSSNCMQCCVGYMLGLPNSEIPNFAEDGGWDTFGTFIKSMGYEPVLLPESYELEADYLASGTTARGTSHMVVMNSGKLVFDPHPSNAGLTDVQGVWLLAKCSHLRLPRARLLTDDEIRVAAVEHALHSPMDFKSGVRFAESAAAAKLKEKTV